MGNKKSKPKPKPEIKPKPEYKPKSILETKLQSDTNSPPEPQTQSQVQTSQEKRYLIDPVFGKMVYSSIAGAWIPEKNENQYEDDFMMYEKEKERNKKFLKTFNMEPEEIKSLYDEPHKSFSIVKSIKLKPFIFNYLCFLHDGRFAANFSDKLDIYGTNLKTVEQTIKGESVFITQLKDHSLVNCNIRGADIYKYDEPKKKFILDYSLLTENIAEKVMELSNDRLALLENSYRMIIYSKKNGKHEEEGKSFCITTMDDCIQINDNEMATISGQESEISFWDLTTRELNAQIGEIKNFQNNNLLLFGKSLIVGGADIHSDENFIYIINIDTKELIKKYLFLGKIWSMTKINEKEFITGENEGIINRYRFEENELKLIETNKDHEIETVVNRLSFCNISNRIASLSDNKFIVFKLSD